MRRTIAYKTEGDRWAAVQARDAAADGHFVYAVRTTGVYCQPSSMAHSPKRENVEFFDSAEAAEAAGYRSSRRARAARTSAAAERAALVARACRLIEASETPRRLDALATEVGLSPFHFHRVFKAETGLTPKAYSSAYRARRLREELSSPDALITHAIYGAGFNSNSRFYEASVQLLGMRARDYRAGGCGAVIQFAVGQCSLGAILVAQSQRGICAILLGDDPERLLRDLQDQFPKAELIGCDSEFERLVAEVVGFVEAPAIGLHLPLDVQGTAFQERVWRALAEVPPGTTVSYAEIAERIGSPKAVRAVARACATNRIAVAIPCHRVVRRDGDMAGYRWGVDRKRELLRREANKPFTLVGPDGKSYQSAVPGSLGGHRGGKLYGQLDCRSAQEAIARGGYAKHRVFFIDEDTAVAAGYRPCAACMPREYAAWKKSQTTRTASGT